MENAMAAQGGAYDYRSYDRVWQRVDPSLNPYPEVRAAATGQGAAEDTTSAAERQAALALPGAEEDPCCMGTEAMESLEVLKGFVREELADQRTYLLLSHGLTNAPARRLFRTLAAEEGRHARRLIAAIYLITGERYCPTICYPPLECSGYCETLRARYHEEACGSFNYARASDGAVDPCLRQLFTELSADEGRHARLVLELLSRAICG